MEPVKKVSFGEYLNLLEDFEDEYNNLKKLIRKTEPFLSSEILVTFGHDSVEDVMGKCFENSDERIRWVGIVTRRLTACTRRLESLSRQISNQVILSYLDIDTAKDDEHGES